jgi:hypothetical protein
MYICIGMEKVDFDHINLLVGNSEVEQVLIAQNFHRHNVDLEI